jgi:hypothetical protein
VRDRSADKVIDVEEDERVLHGSSFGAAAAA